MINKIIEWAQQNGFYLSAELRPDAQCWEHDNGAFLVVNNGDDEEAPFWNLYYSPGDGIHADESGSWQDVPKGGT